MLHDSPNTPGGALWPQRHTFFIAIVKGIHFFFDDIGDLTNRTGKEPGRLDNRQSNFCVTVAGQNLQRGRLHRLPQRRLLWQDVHHPADRLVCRHSKISVGAGNNIGLALSALRLNNLCSLSDD